jgi:hypothetical protein
MIVDVYGSASHIRLRISFDCETTATIYYSKPLGPNIRMFDWVVTKNNMIPVRITQVTLEGTK